MNARTRLMIDFQTELNLDGYGNKQWEDESYQYMFDTVTTIETDDSLSFDDRLNVLDLMNDIHVSLREAYFNALNYLEDGGT